MDPPWCRENLRGTIQLVKYEEGVETESGFTTDLEICISLRPPRFGSPTQFCLDLR